jgi:hypothetical protein
MVLADTYIYRLQWAHFPGDPKHPGWSLDGGIHTPEREDPASSRAPTFSATRRARERSSELRGSRAPSPRGPTSDARADLTSLGTHPYSTTLYSEYFPDQLELPTNFPTNILPQTWSSSFCSGIVCWEREYSSTHTTCQRPVQDLTTSCPPLRPSPFS